MGRLSNEFVGDAYRNGIAWEVLESLVDVENRMAGQEGEHEGAAVIAETLEQIGLREVGFEEFEVPGWWRGSSVLSLSGGRSYANQHQVIALPGTPAGEVRADLVDVGDGTPEEFDAVDVEGALAMTSSETPDDHDRWIHRGEKYDAAVEGGAVGFVFRNHVEGCLPPTGGIFDGDEPGAIPAVGVSRELGSRLVRHSEDDTLEATLSIDCQNEPSSSQNVSGLVGPDTDERVLVTAHHDAHDIAEGAEDNGAGSALVCEVGRLLTHVEDELEVGVECVTFGAEEIGLFGSREMAASREDVRAVVNLDGIGSSRTLRVATHGFDALAAAFEDASDELGSPIDVDEKLEPHSDHWPFVREGVPGLVAQSVTDSEGRGWGHTHADTLDKLDRRDFRDLAVLITAGVLGLATEAYVPEPVSPDEIEARAEAQGIEL